jgi:alkylglycerol monooxygenase
MEEKVVVIASLFFLLMIAAEIFHSIKKGRQCYELKDSISSLSQGLISQLVAACTPFFQIGAYRMIFGRYANSHLAALWGHWYGWILAFVLYDFADYWLHRTSHQSTFFWAAHVVHHQSEFFNLTTALRQESFYPIVGCFFFFPLAIFGVSPNQYAIVSLAVLIYQFWIHTENIGKLGWFDRYFSSPSNHRVHHAVNEQYIDKNFGAVFVIWDRMFGTFKEEGERCVYGTTKPLASWNPFQAIFSVFIDLLAKVKNAKSFAELWKCFFANPSWQPAALKASADIAKAAASAKEQAPRGGSGVLVVSLFILGSVLSAFFLWFEGDATLSQRVMGLAFISATLALSARFMGNRRTDL